MFPQDPFIFLHQQLTMNTDNLTRLKKIFAAALAIEATKVTDDLAYGKDWDSVAHMALVAALESEFDIMMETADVIDLSSVRKAKEILPKYGITFDITG